MDELLRLLRENSVFNELASGIMRGRTEQYLYGLAGSRKSYIMSALFRTIGKDTMAIITYSQAQAEKLFADLATFLGGDEVAIFPGFDILPHEETVQSMDVAIQRLRTLQRLFNGERLAVIIPVKALLRRMPPREIIERMLARLNVGDIVDREMLINRLAVMGYERSDMVEVKGHFSVRGGIIDIFPLPFENPVRIELFDDEIDSIREFDLNLQRSVANLKRVTLMPAREYIIPEELVQEGISRIEAELKKSLKGLEKLGKTESAERLSERVREHSEKLSMGLYFNGAERYLPFFYPKMSTLFDYLGDVAVIVDEPARIKETYSGYESEINESHMMLMEEGAAMAGEIDVYLFHDEMKGVSESFSSVNMAYLPKGVDSRAVSQGMALETRTAPSFHGKIDLLAKELRRYKKRGYRVVALVSTPERAGRLVEMLREENIESSFVKRFNEAISEGRILIAVGELENGFEIPGIKLLLLSDNEIHGKTKKSRRFVQFDEGLRIASYTDLNIGDYVVHINHGIGKYLGVEKLVIGGVQRDYLHVKYAGEDRLYVPTDQVGYLQKYIGPEETSPKLYKLGGNEWNKVKSRVKESVREMAKGLLQLYAERETISGFSYSPDAVWQEEFEDAFQYEETPDQWRAIQEVKQDMERSKPMDRLLCGDVGYGKTEVAIRASFKAIMDNKQVAVLVPTTILAQQHYNTFVERFQGFPVKVAALSRFQTKREQQEILKQLREGIIDIVIGTHRLIQSDIRFKDLGLLIVDEEQRFGVVHKEKLKELKKKVDVLTLTATPIPRTLHMAMVGVRDMSVIKTPPENRFPVRTYVVEYNENLIREVILREIERGGQVYFVHNRVQDIDDFALHIQRLVPEAGIAVAHGQMNEELLERVMMSFLDKEFDVLICTTIIESGLDMPNVNTLIVDNADFLGLSQLYQLRGRVGRSNRVAYAYFMYKKNKVLTEVAEKRLQAIREFTDLGSGFKIAMRDLEIRGAGNILGPEQHGFIASVGFELYCRLLEDAINELKGKRPKAVEDPEPSIELNVDAFIGDEYIGDSRQKIEIYKKINAIQDPEDGDEVIAEVIDRFGDLPNPVANLIEIAKIKALAKKIGVLSINSEKDLVIIRLYPHVEFSGDIIADLTGKYKGRIIFSIGRIPAVKIKAKAMKPSDLLKLVKSLIEDIGIMHNLIPPKLSAVEKMNKTVN